MATYAVGDVQGCYAQLRALLEKCRFDPSHDRLWLTGDLVNRGPASLETLRFVRSLGSSAVSVLGNHDFYLLKVASSGASGRKRHDTLQQILDAPDRDELIDWLRHRPLLYVDGSYVLVHAGLLPQWSVEQALSLAAEVQTALASSDYQRVIDQLWGNRPDRWDDRLQGVERIRLVVNAMTRMRFCSSLGRIYFDLKGGPEKALPGQIPWFAHPERKSKDVTVVFGHWSALGFRMFDNLIATDSGCVWGGRLTAVRLEDRAVFQVSGHHSIAQRLWL